MIVIKFITPRPVCPYSSHHLVLLLPIVNLVSLNLIRRQPFGLDSSAQMHPVARRHYRSNDPFARWEDDEVTAPTFDQERGCHFVV